MGFISIHALVKRATCACLIIKINCIYFNPRPREEGDHVIESKHKIMSIFQSTPSWRGRPVVHNGKIGVIMISIHALVKRATKLEKYTYKLSYISIHALVKRATCSGVWCKGRWLFQSTPSWRGRLFILSNICLWYYFNPRPREEGDKCGNTYPTF